MPVNLQNERWHPVKGWEDRYSVSTLGRVRSLARTDSLGRPVVSRILRPRVGPYGHRQVALSSNGYTLHALVHRLVMVAFGPPMPASKPLVLHRNGNPADNRLCNLRWGNQTDNYADAVRHGTANLRPKPRVLTDDDVAEVKRLWASETWTKREIAAHFKVSASTIGRLCDGPTRRSRITRAQLAEMKNLRNNGITAAEIAKRFGIDIGSVSRITRDVYLGRNALKG